MRNLAAEKAFRKRRDDLLTEVIQMHKAGFGLKRIALKTGVSKTQSRKWLIDAGVYSPPPNSAKLVGEGTRSQYSILIRAAKRKADDDENRKMVAVCLRALRRGIPVERTCKDKGWNAKTAWNYVYKSDGYRLLRAKLRASQRWGDEMAKGRRLGFISRMYRTEMDFQDAIERILLEAGVQFRREARLDGCRTRVDFLIGKHLHAECKVNCKASELYESIGQLFHYSKLSKERPLLLLPDDVTMRSDLAELVPQIPAVILRESQFPGFLKGQPTLPLTSVALKPSRRVALFKCKCCGLEGRQPSRAPSGHQRSFCVECEPLIPDMEYVGKLDRWVKRHQLTLPTRLVSAPVINCRGADLCET